MATGKRCLVVGDSYVKHLERFHYTKFHGFPLTIKGTTVEMRGYPGMDILSVRSHLRNFPAGRYSMVVLVCGSNDLCRSDHTPERVVDDLKSLAQFMVYDRGVDTVVITQLVRRSKARHKYFEITLQQYNNRVDQTNHLLTANCCRPVYFWKHDRRVSRQCSLSKDGVHLNEYGLQHFHRSIRRALSKHI